MNELVWRLDGDTATLVANGARLSAGKPSEGINGLPSIEGTVLGVRPARSDATELVLEEAYCRGADLVARYRPSEGFPFRTEVYWRVDDSSPAADAPRLSLIISVETDLLDTHPELEVTSYFAADEPQRFSTGGSGEDAALLRPADAADATAILAPLPGGGAWFESVHPTDQREADVAVAKTDRRVELRWGLFSRFLEKGVIRRARLAAARFPRCDVHAAGAYHNAFASEAPPLTA